MKCPICNSKKVIYLGNDGGGWHLFTCKNCGHTWAEVEKHRWIEEPI